MEHWKITITVSLTIYLFQISPLVPSQWVLTNLNAEFHQARCTVHRLMRSHTPYQTMRWTTSGPLYPRQSPSVNGATLQRGGGGRDLWRHTRAPITEPLLRRLLNKEELAHQACVTFHTILRYMGDMPGRQSRVGIELTDLIFDGPLKQVWSSSY